MLQHVVTNVCINVLTNAGHIIIGTDFVATNPMIPGFVGYMCLNSVPVYPTSI